MTALLDGPRDIRALAGPQLCTVGSGTAERHARYGIRVDLVPDEFRAEAVVAVLAQNGAVEGSRVLVPRADIGRDVIAEGLRGAGAHVTDVVAYKTVLEEAQQDDGPDIYRMLLDQAIDVVTFTSPSAVRNFTEIYGAEQTTDLLKNTIVAVIGAVTAEAAIQLGIPVAVVPAVATVPALVDAIAAYVSRGRLVST
jgi:uroporphyrinogen III methyltransferase/synthase